MKKLIFLATALIYSVSSFAQGSSLAPTIEVYVFPNSGQDASQQSQDESECYDWAVSNSGNDPFDLAKQEDSNQQQTQQEMANSQTSVRGSGARPALRGAAAFVR